MAAFNNVTVPAGQFVSLGSSSDPFRVDGRVCVDNAGVVKESAQTSLRCMGQAPQYAVGLFNAGSTQEVVSGFWEQH